MRHFQVKFASVGYPVWVGAGLVGELGRLSREAGLAPTRAALVTDSNVGPLYAELASDSLRAAGYEPITIEVEAGEQSKSLEVLATLYDRFVKAQLDRDSIVFALGGGVLGDLAGFAAATYLRGVPLVQVPTTVVAQVDSSLGGKTAVNHRHAKNLLGAFYQPRVVVADVAVLRTLPDREFREGLAEVIKYGAIMDAPMLERYGESLDRILARHDKVVEEFVADSLEHKAAVVTGDEREQGLRRILNFGHTVGHALEAAFGYGRFLHGEAVAIGMVEAAKLSQAYAGLSEIEAERLSKLIDRSGLPTAMPAQWQGEEFERALKLDKKRVDKAVEFVMLEKLGKAVFRRLAFDEILAKL